MKRAATTSLEELGIEVEERASPEESDPSDDEEDAREPRRRQASGARRGGSGYAKKKRGAAIKAAAVADPLQQLLDDAMGRPLRAGEAWTPASCRLRQPPRESLAADSALGGVYWVKAPGGGNALEWAKTQPWFAQLTCTPAKNSLAPGKPKSFEVRYSHATKPEWIGLPRFLGLSLFGPAHKDVRAAGLPMAAGVAFKTDRPLRDYQQRAREQTLRALKEWGGATIIADCGAGKCLGVDTPVLMYDGSVKKVQDVCVGDVLMGDDSSPRNVLSLARGREALYRIRGSSGGSDPYTVNVSHILSLVGEAGEVTDVCVRDLLRLPTSERQKLRGYQAGVTFPERAVPADPRAVGEWLGGGALPGGARIHGGARRRLPPEYHANCPSVHRALLGSMLHACAARCPAATAAAATAELALDSPELLDDATFVARCLGVSVRARACPLGRERCFHASLHSGRDALRTAIRLEPLGEGEYYGFTLDGNRRFLLGDFTVTHNTAMALSIAESLRVKTLVLCNRSFLMQQWRHDIEGKGWTWADDNMPVEGGVADPERAKRVRCAACRAWAFHAEAAAPPAANCAACGFEYDIAWQGTTPPRDGWLHGARVGSLQGPLLPLKRRRDPTAVLAHQSDTVPTDVEDKDIVVASIDSLSQCDYPRELLAQFGLVIVDEMHHLGALTLSQVLPKLTAAFILAITATPSRRDGLESVLYWLAGPTSFVYKRRPSVTGRRGTVAVHQVAFERGQRTEVMLRNGALSYGATVALLARDAARNAALLDIIRRCVAAGRRKILVGTSIVAHAQFLAECLEKGAPGEPDTGVKVVVVRGGCSPAAVSLAKSDAVRVVVATYSFLGEGYDDETLDTLVLAMPVSSVQQILGRIERCHAGKFVPQAWELIDTFCVFEAMAWKRHFFYKSRGFKVRRVTEEDVHTADMQGALPPE